MMNLTINHVQPIGDNPTIELDRVEDLWLVRIDAADLHLSLS